MGHFEIQNTLNTLHEHFIGPIRNIVQKFVKTTFTCKKEKSKVKPCGLYTLLFVVDSP